MNFGKLLAASRSMMPGYETGRYRMRERFHLPQFIAPKNPFTADATAAESVSPPIRSESSPVVSVVTRSQQLARLLALGVARAGELLKRGALWCLDHNPFSAIGRPHLPSIPRFGRPAVQGELSLEKLQVLRGDLAHADLEVANREPASGAGWRALASRVFGSGVR